MPFSAREQWNGGRFRSTRSGVEQGPVPRFTPHSVRSRLAPYWTPNDPSAMITTSAMPSMTTDCQKKWR